MDKTFLVFLFIMIGLSISLFFPYVFADELKLLVNNYDGAKNYFTMISYIFDTDNIDIFQFNGMNYPFGERIFYTDNTPILSVFFRFLHITFGIDSISYFLRFFHFLIMLSFPLSYVYMYKLLKEFDIYSVFAGWASICIVFLSPQLIHLPGSINLGITLVTIVPIYLTIRIFKRIENDQSAIRELLKYSIFIYTISFVHLYFLLINGLFFSLFLLVWLLKERQNIERIKKIVVAGIFAGLVPLIGVLTTIRITDPELSNRKSAMGFNFEAWKLDFISPLSSMEGRTFFHFDLWGSKIPYGSYSFLGYFCILVLFLAVVIYNKNVFKYFGKSFSIHYNLLSILTIVGVTCFFVTLGTKYNSSLFDKNFTNYLSIFYYIELLTDKIHHFRFLNRFWWPAHWIFLILAVFIVDRGVIKRKLIKNLVLSRITLFILISLLTIDAISLPYMVSLERKSNFLSSNELTKSIPPALHPLIESNRFQCYLPLPYFNVGSENYNYTIDGIDEWNTLNFQFQIASDLPMIATILSRTAEHQAISLFRFVNTGLATTDLLELMDRRDILVVYHSGFIDALKPYKDDLRNNLVKKEKNLPELYGMKLIAKKGETSYYSWSYDSWGKNLE